MVTLPPTSAPISSSGTLNVKALVIMVLIAVIIAYCMSKIMKNDITLYDANGNVIGQGELTTKIRAFNKA